MQRAINEAQAPFEVIALLTNPEGASCQRQLLSAKKSAAASLRIFFFTFQLLSPPLFLGQTARELSFSLLVFSAPETHLPFENLFKPLF